MGIWVCVCNIIYDLSRVPYMRTYECKSLKNSHLRLCADSNAISAKHFLKVSLWLLLLDLGNYHQMFLVVEFVFFEDGFDFGEQPNGVWRQVC